MEEEKGSGQAAEAGTGDPNLVPGQASPDEGEGTGGTGEGEGEKKFYTPEELEALHPMDIVEERLNPEDPTHRAILRQTKEYKELQGHSTKISQDLATFREVKPPEEVFFPDDSRKNEAFKQYLKDPMTIVREINAEINKCSNLSEDDPNYKNASAMINYWNGIKEEFALKKDDVRTKESDLKVLDAKIDAEFGQDASKIRDYARSLGFNGADLRRPELRKSIVEMYKVKFAGHSADTKKKIPRAPNLATPGAPGSPISKKPLTEIKDPKEYGDRRGYGKDPDRQFI